MRVLETWALAGALLLTLVGAPARAQSCSRECVKDETACKDVCKKHAGKMAPKCTKACSDEKDACVEDCKRGGYTPRDNGKEEDSGDDDHKH